MDKIARKAFCVGGLFYPIVFGNVAESWNLDQNSKIVSKKL